MGERLQLVASCQRISDFCALGPGGATRKQQDADMGVLKTAFSASTELKVKGAEIGFVQQALCEFVEPFTETTAVYTAHNEDAAEASVQELAPHATVHGDFMSKTAKHFMDDFDFDEEIIDIDALIEFCSATIFTNRPTAFHQALQKARTVKDACTAFNTTFELLDIVKQLDALNGVLEVAEVTKLEGTILGHFFKHKDNAISLKRLMRNHIASIDPKVYSALHDALQRIIEHTAGEQPACKATEFE